MAVVACRRDPQAARISVLWRDWLVEMGTRSVRGCDGMGRLHLDWLVFFRSSAGGSGAAREFVRMGDTYALAARTRKGFILRIHYPHDGQFVLSYFNYGKCPSNIELDRCIRYLVRGLRDVCDCQIVLDSPRKSIAEIRT